MMADYMMWYPQALPDWIPGIAQQRATLCCDQLERMPPGERVIQIRWMFMYEGYVRRWNVNPVPIFEQGFIPIGRAVRYLRPLGAELKRRGLQVDAIWVDTEAGFTSWNLDMSHMQAIYGSTRARATMPRQIRNFSPNDFLFASPNFRTATREFNRWTELLMTRAVRNALTQGGLMWQITPQGTKRRIPIVRYTGVAPTWPTYDNHDWLRFNTSPDGTTSSTFFTIYNGTRYDVRMHDRRWNALCDWLNVARSTLARPGGMFWPLVNQPVTYFNSPWLFEQLVAHLARTGVNWSNKNAWLYFNEQEDLYVGQSTVLWDIIARHDEAFPVQRSLPEIQLDCDSITTAGFTTTYEDFLNNIDAPVMAGDGGVNP